MSSIAPRNSGEKRVLQAGKKSLTKYRAWVYILCAVIWALIGVYWGYALLGGRCTNNTVLGLSVSVFSCTLYALKALVHFERRHFYQIIERQNKRIAVLEQKSNEPGQDV